MAHFAIAPSPTVSLVLASALWAVGTVISKAALSTVPPVTFLILQLAPSVLVLWILVLASGPKPTSWRGLFPLALLGWLNPGLSYTLSMLGLKSTPASVATLLWAAEPALIVVAAYLVLRENISLRLALVTATAAFGVLLVSGLGGNDDLANGSGSGAALILGGVLCCALYTVLSRKVVATVDPLFTVAVQQTVGLLWAVLIWPLELQGAVVGEELTLSPEEMLGGAVSGLMYYVAAFWFYLRALRSVPASTAGMFFNLIPVFGIATAFIFLGERLTLSQWGGAAIILLSMVVLLTWSTPQKEPAPAE